MITMRNPWAGEEYSGPWNKKDKRWSPEMQKQIANMDPSVFFLPMSYFLKHFDTFAIAMVEDEWQVSKKFFSIDKNKMYFEFENKKE